MSQKQRIQDAVDAVHGLFAGCTLAMLVDQETGLVLCRSDATELSQNILDGIASTVRAELTGPMAQALMELSSGATIVVASVADSDGVTMAVQDIQGGEDALVCRFAKAPKRTELIDMARAVFETGDAAEAA